MMGVRPNPKHAEKDRERIENRENRPVVMGNLTGERKNDILAYLF